MLRESDFWRSRCFLPSVEPGSMAYSAVSQPLPFPARKGGTRSSTFAVTSTRVLPHSTRQEPGNWA